jgi:solute carrier family 35 protein F5
VVMKKRVKNEDRVNMPLFFGLVGLFNLIFLWPGFIILHLTGIETFELPPTGKIWAIIVVIIPRHPGCDMRHNMWDDNVEGLS